MSFRVRANLEGARTLGRAMEALAVKARKQAARKAATAGGAVILGRVKQTAPKELGILKKSLGKKIKVYPSGVAVAVIGPRQGFRQAVVRKKGKWAPAPPPPSGFANPVNYTHLVEFGTKRSRGFSFIADAVRSTRAAAIDAMRQAILKVLGVP